MSLELDQLHNPQEKIFELKSMLDEFTHVLGDLRGQVSQVSDDEFEKGMEMSDRANPWIWTGSKKTTTCSTDNGQ